MIPEIVGLPTATSAETKSQMQADTTCRTRICCRVEHEERWREWQSGFFDGEKEVALAVQARRGGAREIGRAHV